MNHATRRIDAATLQAAQSEGITSAQRINGTPPELIGLPVIDPDYFDEQRRRVDPYSSCDAHFNQVEFYQDIERLKREGQAAAFIALLLVALILGTAFYSVLP
jgi:hypothetical protein